MHRRLQNDLPSLMRIPLDDDEALGRHVVLQLVSTPSLCLFVRGDTLAGSGSFAMMRKLVDARCGELGLSEAVRARALSYSTSLLSEALHSLFKQRQ